MTGYIGIIGYPLKHSISPVFQQAALDYYGLDICYQVWETQRVTEAVARLRQPQSLGANVTVPHKEAIIPFLDSLEPLAREIGAVNTIVKEDSGLDKGRLKGHNTDAPGFLQALRQEAGFEPGGRKAVLLGAGGVARAVGFALLGAGASSLSIFNRTPVRARSLAQALSQRAKAEQTVAAYPWQEAEMGQVLAQADLIVNCTTLGMKHGPGDGQSPLAAQLIPKGALVYDLVYNPVETPLIREACQAGARCLGGLAMLVYQGAAAFELWTGRVAPLDIMFQAAKQALK